jgi:hypothetical protein
VLHVHVSKEEGVSVQKPSNSSCSLRPLHKGADREFREMEVGPLVGPNRQVKILEVVKYFLPDGRDAIAGVLSELRHVNDYSTKERLLVKQYGRGVEG